MKKPSESSRTIVGKDGFAAIVTLLIFVRYFVEMIRYSRSQPLWLDEILTVWLVRLGSVNRIYEGLAKGAEYSPPGFPVLLLWWSKICGADYLSLRSPSFVGIALAAIALFLLVRRYMDFSIADASSGSHADWTAICLWPAGAALRSDGHMLRLCSTALGWP